MSFTITCPVCGKRNLYEFKFGGEDHGPGPGEENLSPEAWADWAYMNDNVPGPRREWWCHKDGCGLWFCASRDAMTNRETPESEGLP